ncbi:TAXI family TRAP transporter solute-binding subunit [Lentzea nigeriaca]|uniref:TAXI family TRAP transporter solute-binding subunit n=1 Tax=Lentzea nigeriaca TaxID=1128665 RepID=UPI00195CD7CD|nr:TAXI family TRAP transporter solute-binding subunit [Lentzea nigeriaca]MBM7862779.1 TRAP transporter TAXI family solute receptor [Lentzea nigeriaca]
MSLSRRTLLLGAGLALAGCTPRKVDAPAELVLATGPDGAVFREVGGALAEALAEQLPGTKIIPLPTAASVENLRLLKSGGAQLALSSLDPIDEPEKVRAVGRLYDSFMQIAVPKASPIEKFRDLAGKRISLGPIGSGTEFTGTRMLNHFGVSTVAERMAHAVASRRVAEGSLDAMLALTGIPTPAITDLHGKVRLIDIPDEATEFSDTFRGPYIPATIPAKTYEALQSNKTFAVPNLLLAHETLSADVVEVVTRTVFTETARIVEGHPEAARINVRTGIATGNVPLHDGAARWFRSVKR